MAYLRMWSATTVPWVPAVTLGNGLCFCWCSCRRAGGVMMFSPGRWGWVYGSKMGILLTKNGGYLWDQLRRIGISWVLVSKIGHFEREHWKGATQFQKLPKLNVDQNLWGTKRTNNGWSVLVQNNLFFWSHFEITIINKQGELSISTKWVPCPTMGAIAVWGWVIILHLGPLVRTRICVAMSSATTLQWARARSIRSWACLQQISFALEAKVRQYDLQSTGV